MEGPKHFSCALIWRPDPKGTIEFLVMYVASTDRRTNVRRRQLKFPGGTNRIPDETPELTVWREVLEETYLAILQGVEKKIWEFQVSADHTKFGYLIPFAGCSGQLRSSVLEDDNDVMEVPFWLSVDDLKMRLFEGHQPPFIAACRELGIM